MEVQIGTTTIQIEGHRVSMKKVHREIYCWARIEAEKEKKREIKNKNFFKPSVGRNSFPVFAAVRCARFPPRTVRKRVSSWKPTPPPPPPRRRSAPCSSSSSMPTARSSTTPPTAVPPAGMMLFAL
uniref:Uncharacterized protein n=1 Tax=Anopheles christyi TaxID=43041 RepID=A0A182KJ14_9DIPT